LRREQVVRPCRLKVWGFVVDDEGAGAYSVRDATLRTYEVQKKVNSGARIGTQYQKSKTMRFCTWPLDERDKTFLTIWQLIHCGIWTTTGRWLDSSLDPNYMRMIDTMWQAVVVRGDVVFDVFGIH
jgi:hypothetical protein